MSYPGLRPLTLRPPVDGETPREAAHRRYLNKLDRQLFWALASQACLRCGQVRANVIHELDREHSPEGPEYFADVPFCEFLESDA